MTAEEFSEWIDSQPKVVNPYKFIYLSKNLKVKLPYKHQQAVPDEYGRGWNAGIEAFLQAIRDAYWKSTGMTPQRHQELTRGHGVGAELTEEERKSWCFCVEWDGMLIHKDDQERECCTNKCMKGEE